MLSNSTPFTFLFLSVYSLLLFCLLSLQDFLSIWILIELMILVFLGISYTVLTSSFSSIMQYFLIQTLASFSIFIFYFLSSPVFYTLAFLIKLAMFPFFSWFLSLVNRFPNILLILSSTFHKLPPFYLMLTTLSTLSISLIIFSAILSLLVSSFVMLSLSDLRLLIIASSIGNNAWFFLALCQGIHLFALFFFLYSVSFCAVILFFRASSTLHGSVSPSFIILFLSLSGFPPFPLFFAKAYVIFTSFAISYSILLLLLFAALVLVRYLRSLFHFITLSFSSFPSLLLSWEVSLYKTLVFKTSQAPMGTSRTCSCCADSFNAF